MNPLTMIELRQAQYRGFDRCYRLMNWVRSRAHYDALALLLYVFHDKTGGCYGGALSGGAAAVGDAMNLSPMLAR